MNLVEVYKGGDIEKENEVGKLLAHISQNEKKSNLNNNQDNVDSNEIKDDKVGSKNINRNINRPTVDFQTTQRINIDSVVSSLDNESGYDEVRRYYGMSYQNTIPPGNLYSIRQVIAETELVEEIKLSRKNKINARHERQKMRDDEDGNFTPSTSTSASSATSSSTSYTSSARPQKIPRPPRIGIEDSPNRGRVWVHNTSKGSTVSTGATQG